MTHFYYSLSIASLHCLCIFSDSWFNPIFVLEFPGNRQKIEIVGFPTLSILACLSSLQRPKGLCQSAFANNYWLFPIQMTFFNSRPCHCVTKTMATGQTSIVLLGWSVEWAAYMTRKNIAPGMLWKATSLTKLFLPHWVIPWEANSDLGLRRISYKSKGYRLLLITFKLS